MNAEECSVILELCGNVRLTNDPFLHLSVQQLGSLSAYLLMLAHVSTMESGRPESAAKTQQKAVLRREAECLPR